MIARLQSLPIQAQVVILLLAAPVVVATLGVTLAPLAVQEAMVGYDESQVVPVARAVRLTVGFTAVCAVVAAVGAAALLGGSIASVVGRMQEATDALARGRFRHRISSERKDRLGSLARAIDQMAARLERLELARRRMLANVSHELRTPLTIIRGHAFTLARHEIDGERRAAFLLIDHEVCRLNDLIEELVDAATLQAGGVTLDREACDLDELVESVALRFALEASARDVDIATDICGAVDAEVDVARMHQALGNLVANAIRHADPGSTISLRLTRRAHGAIAVEVRNTGAPVLAADTNRIFEPFEQAGIRSGRVGLGLSISRSIVEAHGGTLRLAPQGEERDVAFVIEIPGPGTVARDMRRRASHGVRSLRVQPELT